jgi:Ribosomal protein L16/L10E
MLQPARRKFRKEHKGRNTGVATRGNSVAFGDFGLKSTDRGRLTARQIEAARRAISVTSSVAAVSGFVCSPTSQSPLSLLKCVWVTVRVTPSTTLPKSSPARSSTKSWVCPEELAREAFRLAAAKLPLRTTFVSRHIGE